MYLKHAVDLAYGLDDQIRLDDLGGRLDGLSDQIRLDGWMVR